MPPFALLLRLRRATGIAATVAGLSAAAVLACAPPAGANPPAAADPHGAVTTLTASSGHLNVAGWAYDPSARTANLTVAALVDGHTVAASVTTRYTWPTIRARYRTGPTPGFRMTVPVASGHHTVCIVARDLGAGLNTVLRCVVTPLGYRLSATQTAAHSPRGAITHRWANAHSVHFQGWATDPDYPSRRSVIVLYVDNRAVATRSTVTTGSPRPAGSGPQARFDILVPTAVGAHVGCVWAVNVGIGSNRFLGCATLDNRGPAGSGAVAHPSLNAKVAAEAKRHIGQPYVWGAAGPTRFDCSGLVQYSYHKFGRTVPRVSQDQFRAARLIPASRAVPGDPVFYFDRTGDVYHVGIYLGPGRTVAAIDEAEGVDYQRIWDPSSTAYGSFTHT